MNDEIQALIDSLRRGQYEDPREKISLLSAALQEGKADVPFLLSLLRAPQIPLRLAALDACRERPEPDLLAELALLVDHSDARARLKLAGIIAAIAAVVAGGGGFAAKKLAVRSRELVRLNVSPRGAPS